MTAYRIPWPRIKVMACLLPAFFFLAPAHPATAPPAVSRQSAASVPRSQLDALLARAAEYCRRLESASFDFVCREEISESINPSLDDGPKIPPPEPGGTSFAGPAISFGWTNKVKRTFVYDFQCGRAGGAIHETRALLELNGKKKAVPDARLEPPVVVYGAAVLGPVALFGERFQPDYTFSVAGEEKVGQARVLVVEATPKHGAPRTSHLYAKAWVDPVTGAVLRFEWSESRAGRFDVFEKRGNLYKRTPRLVIRSEYGVERNGIRLPGRLSVEEAYLNDAGKAAVRSRTVAVYRDIKFSAVDS